jgi:hypothetical protein
LNLKKYIFLAPFIILLGHIVCKKGLLADPSNIFHYFGISIADLGQKAKRNVGTYRLLQEVYSRLCADYNTHGKVVEERSQVPME